ncbi:MAG TPA: ATP-dependent zinc metalloprotease FtsH [Candidatus Acidoferrales bacterium]|nr:ATP-dependent zinc metalloprotease FtsH [Candidatus Acidoferrales bacterium]
MDKNVRFHLIYLFFALIALVLIRDVWHQLQQVETIDYSEFRSYLDAGRIEEVTISGQYLTGTLRQPTASGRTQFVTTRVDPELANELLPAGVRFRATADNPWIREVLSWIVPIALLVLFWSFLLRRMGQGQSGLMAIGRSKAKIYVESDTRVTFEDVAGVDEAKEELREIVAFLKDPKGYGKLGARIPKGVLLVGPPGTGKTLLARAMAGEAQVPFFSISGSEFVEMFVGVGAARVRDLFEQARKSAPAIIFIDELDALGRARGAFPGIGGHDEREQTLNQLLTEMDGFDASGGLILVAATNRPEILDPALLRAGRFDRQILVDRPDKRGRVQILAVHLKKIRLAPEVDSEQIASLTTGFSGADLANLVNEAALQATRRGREAVTMDDFTTAVERIVAGLEKRNRLLNPREREIVAHHEMGHAFVALGLGDTDRVHKVSIIPRGIGALGYTIQRPTEDRFLMSRRELENKIAVLLGGRAAEVLIFNELSTGAADDLVKATDIARNMVIRYGMDDALGHVAYAQEQNRFLDGAGQGQTMLPVSEQTARAIDEAVQRIIAQAFERARGFLARNRPVLEAAAQELLQRETLDEACLSEWAGRLTSPSASVRAPPAPTHSA